jgi:hypothetical protein
MEEEKDLFPEVERSDMDLNTVGKQLEGRKMELMDGSRPALAANRQEA